MGLTDTPWYMLKIRLSLPLAARVEQRKSIAWGLFAP